MKFPTILRRGEEKAIQTLSIRGEVLDIGGDTRSDYRRFIAQSSLVTTVNLDLAAGPDIVADLEKKLDGYGLNSRFDEVLVINVLEHVYRAEGLLCDAVACLKKGGRLTVVVPFLFPVHPSPHDYRRFTGETLQRMFIDAGLHSVVVTSLGSGIFAATTLMFERLMPLPIRALISVFLHKVVYLLDFLFVRVARILGKSYKAEDYAVGYMVTGRL